MLRWPPAAAFLVALALCLCPGTPAAQPADPKSTFVDALGAFSLSLDGTYGDEGPRILTALDTLDRAAAAWDAAIAAYEAEAARNPPADATRAASMHLALGGLYLDRTRLADAIREFDAAIALDPARADAFTMRGLASAAAHDVRGAAASFRKALDLEPSDTARAYLLARALARAGQPDEALSAIRRVSGNQTHDFSGRSSASSPTFMRFGLVEERPGVEPFFPPAIYAAAFARLQAGDIGKATTLLREAAASDVLVAGDIDRSYAMRKAAEAFRAGDLAGAVMQLQATLELYPKSAEPHRILGLVYAADGQLERAEAELRLAVTSEPSDERARLALADVLTRDNRLAAAEQALHDAIAAIPRSGRAHYLLARLYQRQGKQIEALGEFQTAAGFAPLLGLNSIYQTTGVLAAARQEFTTAVDAFSRRVDIVPNAVGAHQDLGDTYARLGRSDEALAEYAVALALDPARADAQAGIAQLELRAGHNEMAAEAARRALAIEPAHRQARYSLGTALVRLGRVEDGQRELDEFQRLQAIDAADRARDLELGALRREASVASEAGDHQKAVTLLRRALGIAPNDMVSHLNLGMALMLAGQPAEAVERFNTAVAMNGPDEVHQRLAEAYARMGRDEDSRHELEMFESLKRERLQRAGAGR